ncbi:protein adenylyltransferase SelO family protein [Leptolyngbya sp. KIOST-1]|uniref:protein adenylyltransferase SelO family protein n=1 Tax=Leptolyngbya sp. KIOST-1 TaxID=1229172 RepID=UPI000562D81F|nr:protein adenylyltransferase SelO family protein [Leptolyngbya sp. KIOST-1]
MLQKLGFEQLDADLATALVNQTIDLLSAVQVGYHDFFFALTEQFSPRWREQAGDIFSTTLQASDSAAAAQLEPWRQIYHRCLQSLKAEQMEQVAALLKGTNPQTVLLRPEIEAVWEPITTEDNWQPFYDLLAIFTSSI